ncbi:MAG TPA: tRNA-specific adenosine deaminase, partial [Chitinophagaceae bacterium]|nr:tRNA-specific adenosine deaminase [Chitinophagaceae bacterium]
MGALYWARPVKVYYANSRADAAKIGFDDAYIYDELTLPIEKRKIKMECLQTDEALRMFEEWKAMNNKTLY